MADNRGKPMTIMPRYHYEVVATDVTLQPDGQSAIVLIDTGGPIDLGLFLSRDTLELLRSQIDSEIANLIP